jgi:outer membrane receptor protein involved in Fe transport
MTRSLLFLGALGLAAGTVWAQTTPVPPAEEKKKEAEDTVKREEVVVVTASKVESTLVNAPATVSVVGSEAIATASATNYGDLLRNVPGLNVIQMSARDINITSRQSTSTLSNSQLALLDGRSIYLDFFGLILWDLVPASTGEIKQIEVVRGPASAVWGANALTGVVNIITKPPRELAKEAAGSLTLSGGLINRSDGSRSGDGNGYAYGASAYIAQAPNDKWSYKLSAGYFNSDPFSRPTGSVPLDCHPLGTIPCRDAQGQATPGGVPTGGAPYPPDTDAPGGFRNSNTSQPKVDLRVDQEVGDGGRMSYSGGYAGTTGIVHTGIGPFQLQSGSYLGYGRIGYSKGAFKLAGFVNFLDAQAPNLLLTDPDTLQPVQLNFKTQTYDLEVGHSLVLGGKNIVSFGGNARRNAFDITLAPDAQNRNEFGVYVQDELFFDKFRFNVGLRMDKFGNLADPFFSPRVTAMFKPTPAHSIRVSFNRAFRAPSAINNYLQQDIFLSSPLVDLRALAPFAPPALRPALADPFLLRVRNVGSEVRRDAGSPVPGTDTALDAESLNAYELAYTGTFGKTTLGLAVYQNDSNNNINFTTIAPTSGAFAPLPGPGFDVYTPGNAPQVIGITPAGSPVPGVIVPFLYAVPPPFGPVLLPRTVSTYLNLGPLRQRGLEASISHNLNDVWSFFANYSFQGDPKPLTPDPGQLPYPTAEIGVPARNRFNAGVSWNAKRFLGSAGVNYSDKAFWTDVLSAPYFGATDSYTMLNASFGVKWLDGKLVTTLKGTNLANQTIQQHVFGDILKLQVYFEAKMMF